MDLRYPVGKFQKVSTLSETDRRDGIDAIAELPKTLGAAIEGLSDAQLGAAYRPGGWTVRQVVHHVADSHANAYIRTRFALTETEPTVKPYNEATWAELPDARTMPPSVSLVFLDAMHARWVALLRSLKPADFARTLMHPENGVMTLDSVVAMYSWHGRHHTAHITELRKRDGI